MTISAVTKTDAVIVIYETSFLPPLFTYNCPRQNISEVKVLKGISPTQQPHQFG